MCYANYDMFVVLYGKGLALKILMNNLLWPAILLQVEKQLVDQPLLMFEGRAVLCCPALSICWPFDALA